MKAPHCLQVVFVCFGLIVAACSNSDSGQARSKPDNKASVDATPAAEIKKSSEQTSAKAGEKGEKTSSELATLILKSIDYDKLQRYFHVATLPERKPLVILSNRLLPAPLELVKFDQAVAFATCDELKTRPRPYIEFTKIETLPATATTTFRYYVEGVEVTLDFVKENGVWTISKGQLNEKRFRDNGCSGK